MVHVYLLRYELLILLQGTTKLYNTIAPLELPTILSQCKHKLQIILMIHQHKFNIFQLLLEIKIRKV